MISFPLRQFVGWAQGQGQGQLLVAGAILPAGCPAPAATLQQCGGSCPFTKAFLTLRKGKTQVIVCSENKSGSTVSPTNGIKLLMKII